MIERKGLQNCKLSIRCRSEDNAAENFVPLPAGCPVKRVQWLSTKDGFPTWQCRSQKKRSALNCTFLPASARAEFESCFHISEESNIIEKENRRTIKERCNGSANAFELRPARFSALRYVALRVGSKRLREA